MGPLLRNQDLVNNKISPYSNDIAATQLRDTIPTICNASMTSLGVSMTAIAEGAVSLRLLTLLALKLNATICGHCNLSIVQCCCLLDLLLDDCKCVQLFSPEVGD